MGLSGHVQVALQQTFHWCLTVWFAPGFLACCSTEDLLSFVLVVLWVAVLGACLKRDT